jgi:XRE family transcriptional regulator, regulator of sulfur utilization
MDNSKPPAISLNIMNQRKLKNMSMDELSKRSGVSKSMLSQIEQEKTNPTVITVWKIARAFDISVEQLLETGMDYQIEVLRREDAPVIYSEDKSCTVRVNTPIHMTDNLELYNIDFKPMGKLSSKPHFPNSEEFLTVISGKFRVTSNSSVSILNEGDTARYKADQEHCIENLSDQEAHAYLVVWFAK